MPHEEDDDCEVCDTLKIMKQARIFDNIKPPTKTTPQQTTQQKATVTSSQQATTIKQATATTTTTTSTTQPTNQTPKQNTQASDAIQPTTVKGEEPYWKAEDPPDLYELGKGTWTLLHSVAAYYPDKPTEKKEQEVQQFIKDVSKVFPCRDCADDFAEHIDQNPINTKTRKDLSLWMCDAHNHVNERLGKPKFDCSLVDKRWRFERYAHNKDDTQ